MKINKSLISKILMVTIIISMVVILTGCTSNENINLGFSTITSGLLLTIVGILSSIFGAIASVFVGIISLISGIVEIVIELFSMIS